MNPLLLKAAPWVVAIAVGGGWFLNHNAQQRALGAAAVRDSISAVAIAALRKDSAQLVARITRLRTDSAALAHAGEQTRADFRRELARWRALAGRIDTVEVAGDTTPRLPMPDFFTLLRQANATIAACQADTLNCEQRAANAEARVKVADSTTKNAEGRADEYLRQRDDARGMLPSRFGTSAKLGTAAALGFALCKWVLCPKPK